MLTTEEEFNKNTEKPPKYKYIASCNHIHIIYFHVFLNRKIGVIFPDCIRIRNSNKIKDDIKNDKIKYLKQELNCIDFFYKFNKRTFFNKKSI